MARGGLAVLLLWAVAALPIQAADKSGVAPNTISLPSGPGSIEGLGQAFQPTLNTGTAKHGIGLILPPGTAGHAPSLSLSYDGGGANGPLSFGWSLPVPYVQRKTEDGVPLYPGDSPPTAADDWSERYDSVINEMKEDLVPTADGYWFCRNEGAFIRYRRVEDHWEAHRPNGTLLEFGLTPSGRVDDGQGRVFSWLLERETDTHGNTIVYEYRSFPGDSNRNQKYLSQVRYGPGVPPWDNFHFAQFIYEERPDWFEDCRPGYPVRTGMRLKSMVVGTQGPVLEGHLAGDFSQDGVTDHLNRRYDLEYLPYAGAESHWSLLGSVTLVGADNDTSLPPATFNYTVCDPPDALSAAGHVLGSAGEPFLVMDDAQVDFIDLNADGLPDILRTYALGGMHRVSLNQGLAEVGGSRVVQWAEAIEVGGDPLVVNVNLESTGNTAHLADMDGDGMADLTYTSPLGDVFFFPNQILAWGERRRMSVADFPPPSPFKTPSAKSADVDGDKRIDIIQSVSSGLGSDYRIWFNLGDQTYAQSTTVSQLQGLALDLDAVHIADFNGDRLPDIARIRPSSIEVLTGLGYGRFAPMVEVPVPNGPLSSTQISRAKLTDLTGDGLVDLVVERPLPGALWYWVNLGTYNLSSLKQIIDMPSAISERTAIRWADVNGNGSTDLVYADSLGQPRLRTVDVGELLTGGIPPNLITNIANGIGRVTAIDYASSVEFALADAAAGQPWPDPLPNPVHVVQQVTTFDSLGHSYVTGFRYHDGYYDAEEKQFRGFGHVEQIEVGDETAPTLVTRHRFDTGRNYEVMKGKLLFQAAETEDGGVFWEETTDWVSPPKTLHSGTNGEAVHYTHPTAKVRLVKELGQGTERRLESEFDYDDYGNEILNANYGIVENGDRSAFDDERVVNTEYAYNPTTWMLRFPFRSEVSDDQGSVISRTESFYDDETFSGANPRLVLLGNRTLERQWIDPADADGFINAVRSKYDPYGNVVFTVDPLGRASGGVVDLSVGHARTMAYDEQFRAYPVSENIYVGGNAPVLVYTAEYDVGHGILTSGTDFDGDQSTFGYDPLARLVHEVIPPDAADYPTVEYRYVLAAPHGEGGLVNYVETRQLDREPGSVGDNRDDHYMISRSYHDGLGRKLMAKIEAEPLDQNAGVSVVVKEAATFNARQGVREVLNPYFTTLTGSTLGGLLAYEDINTQGWTGRFEQQGELFDLDRVDSHKLATDYDATLRTLRVINQDGTTRQHRYEPLVSFLYDENDTDSTSVHHDTPMIHREDGLGRLMGVDEVVRLDDQGETGPLTQWQSRYQYDLNDQLVRVTDAQQNVREFVYDGLQRLIEVRDPDRGSIELIYDEASNLLESVDAKGQRITHTYDGANRMLTEDLHDEGQALSHGYVFDPSVPVGPANRPDVAYFYDAGPASVSQGDGTFAEPRNLLGRLAFVWDQSGEQYLSYDDRGREEWVVKRIRETRESQALISFRTAYEYDSFDRLTRIVYPDNDFVSYAYDRRGLVSGIFGDPSGAIVQDIRYHPSGQEVDAYYGNGTRTVYEYDQRLRLLANRTVHDTDGGEAQSLIDLTYEYDRFSNLIRATDGRPAPTGAEWSLRKREQRFVYDDVYRLVRAESEFHGGASGSLNTAVLEYRYDRIGNMLSLTAQGDAFDGLLRKPLSGVMESGGQSGRWGRGPRLDVDAPGPHALTRLTPHTPGSGNEMHYSYDANGNLEAVDESTLLWDFKDRLAAVDRQDSFSEYIYDYADRRIVKNVRERDGSGPIETPKRVLYVNRHYEVRSPESHVKYVWKGNVRICRVTRTLSQTSNHVQRIRVVEGWNLVSVAVGDAALPLDTEPALESAFQWNAPEGTFRSVQAGERLGAGTVLWLKANRSALIALTGTLDPGGITALAAGRSFMSLGSVEPVTLPELVQQGVGIWRFDSAIQEWQVHQPEVGLGPGNLPEALTGGETVFVHATAPVEIATASGPRSLRFYHHDHLGSVVVTTDADGQVVTETYRHPFGDDIASSEPRGIGEDYGFTQKERDEETGLHYFEARFMASQLGRFVNVDPLAAEVPDHWLTTPQTLNTYAYARNNPVNLTDPTGLESVGEWLFNKAGQASDEGSTAKAYALGTAFTLWETVGFEGVSKLENKRIHGKEITTGDVVAAGLEVATMGKGGGLLGKGISKLGKAATKGAKAAVKAGKGAVSTASGALAKRGARRAAREAAKEVGKRARNLASKPSARLFEPATRAEIAKLNRVRSAANKKMREITKKLAKDAGFEGWRPLGDMSGGEVYTGLSEFLGIKGGIPAVAGEIKPGSRFTEGSGLVNSAF